MTEIFDIDGRNETLTEEDMERNGFYKVSHDGGTYVTGTFYNPETKEYYYCRIRDYDYSDCSRDNDSLYCMEINEDVRRQWLHDNGIILSGDTVKVIKGRKIPIGSVKTVKEKRPWKDRYGRTQAVYLYFTDGTRTNENNCILI